MKISLDISFESSAKQTIHMKYQDLFWQKIHMKYQDFFSLKNENIKKILECRLLQTLLGALRITGLFHGEPFVVTFKYGGIEHISFMGEMNENLA